MTGTISAIRWWKPILSAKKGFVFVAVLLLVAIFALLFSTAAMAQDVATSTEVAVSSPPVQLITEAQVEAALGGLGTTGSTETATSINLPYLGLTDVSSVAKKAHFGTMFDTKGRNWALAYMAIQTPLNDWTHDMVALGAGFAYQMVDKNGALVLGPVVQCDNIVSKVSAGKYSIPSIDLIGGASLVYQASASPQLVGFIGIAYGFKRKS